MKKDLKDLKVGDTCYLFECYIWHIKRSKFNNVLNWGPFYIEDEEDLEIIQDIVKHLPMLIAMDEEEIKLKKL